MYYAEFETAEKDQARWLKRYKEVLLIFKIPTNTKWKYWLGTQESWDKECIIIIEKRKNK